MIDVSVISPARDRSLLLTTALKFVLWQREVSLEVIVVDDGSSDDIDAVVTAVDDPRVTLLRHDGPLGLSASRNHGAQEAKGEWLAFIDDDDVSRYDVGCSDDHCVYRPERLRWQDGTAAAIGTVTTKRRTFP